MHRKKLLHSLRERILKGDIPKADQNWGGADVAIVDTLPEKTEEGFYPDPFFVATRYSLELSWLFEEIASVFKGQLDYQIKYEFFGQLANAAVEHIERYKDGDCTGLLVSVLDQAESMIE